MVSKLKIGLGVVVAGALAGVVWWQTRPDPNINPVVADGGEQVTVLPFTNLTSPQNLSAGWTHRTFWRVPAMELSLVDHQGTAAMRCETNAGGSILFRSADIALADYPVLTWDWFIEKPIDSAIDEREEAGDDHPARLFFSFLDEENQTHALEIIWSNKHFTPGEYKYIGDFPHYVANGLDENIGQWHAEQINLLDIYRTVTDRIDSPKVTRAGIFCDSDNTGSASIAYFSDVSLNRP